MNSLTAALRISTNSNCELQTIQIQKKTTTITNVNLSQSHASDDCEHDLLALGRIRILDVLAQPGLERAGRLSRCVLTSNFQSRDCAVADQHHQLSISITSSANPASFQGCRHGRLQEYLQGGVYPFLSLHPLLFSSPPLLFSPFRSSTLPFPLFIPLRGPLKSSYRGSGKRCK